MTYGIETTAFVFVTGARHADLDAAAQRLRGKYWAKDGHYSYPLAAEAEIRTLVATLDVPQTAPVATPAAPTSAPTQTRPAGWSKAAKRSQTNPLGQVARTGSGFTMYEDEFTGSGQVQIWDRS
jgi:hypothetical protein